VKIALIGAGSREFGPATLRDIWLSEPLARRPVHVSLMDLDAREVERTGAYAAQLQERLPRGHRVTTTTDLHETLDGADFVVMAIEIGRYYYWAQDFHVPRDHGFRQIYGENGGPGGLFHALRNMIPSLEICRVMEQRCPGAWLLNYTNPLAKLCEAQTRLSSVKVIGLCHGVLRGMEQACRILGHPVDDFEGYACGLNHIAWFQEMRSRSTGEDLYPKLRAREREAHWLADWDQIALSRILLRTFGLFPSPGANHIGEYVRWAEDFLGSSLLQFFYDPRDGHPWETGRVPTWIYNLEDHPTDAELFPAEHPVRLRASREVREGQSAEVIVPSGELGVPIVEGLACGERHELPAVNVPNRGWIPNLPDDAVVEVPATVDGDGLHPRSMAPLPEAVAALLRLQASINLLLVQAFERGSRDLLLQALLIDPTCGSYRQAVSLIDRMCALQGDALPELAWRTPGTEL
jgi:alpha-galactosidase